MGVGKYRRRIPPTQWRCHGPRRHREPIFRGWQEIFHALTFGRPRRRTREIGGKTSNFDAIFWPTEAAGSPRPARTKPHLSGCRTAREKDWTRNPILRDVPSTEVASFKIGLCFQYEKRKIVVEKGKKEDRTQERRYSHVLQHPAQAVASLTHELTQK